MIRALLYNSCTSCRKTDEVLKESGVEYERREYFKDRFTRDELRLLLASVNLRASNVVSTRSKVYRDRNLGDADLNDEQMLELMVEEPTLLRRPIVVNGDQVLVGHNEKKLRELIESDA